MLYKKAISPVVATALLVVVAVFAVIGFQTFFGTFSSGLFSKVETGSSLDNRLKVEGVFADTLYLKSNSNQILSTLKIFDSENNEKCSFERKNTSVFNSTRVLLNLDNQIVNDSSEFHINVTTEGSINCNVAGINNNSCYFDKIDDVIILNQSNYFNFYGVRTFSVWIKSTVGNNLYTVGQADTGAVPGLTMISNGNALFSTYNSSPTAITCNYPSGTILPYNNTWHHIVAIQNRDSSGSYFKIYINGNLSCYRDVGNISAIPLTNLHLGSRTNKDTYYGGYIDEFTIYSKILTDEEVNTLYNSKKALFHEQIIPTGVKEIDIRGCNLEFGKEYNIVIFTNKNKLEQKVIVK